MPQFLLKRLLTLIATLIATSIIVFLVLEILPGDPALLVLGIDATDEQLAVFRQQYGLDRPILERYTDWIGNLLVGDFGISYAYKTPVWQMIADRLPLTYPLTLMAMLLTILLALGLGVFAAARHNKPADVIVMGISQLGISIPNFWFGLLLILLFAVNLGWLSAGGFPGWADGLGPGLQSLILPSIALAAVQAAILARITRSSVLEVLREDFVRTARAKGLSRHAVLWRHVLRNALIPVVTMIGLQFGNLLAGAIVVEQVFSLPGLGRLIFQAINNRDIEVVKAAVVLLAFTVVTVNFIVDVLYAVIDPRLKARDV
ncbi:ABC transporter permease [uncultured Ferrovibrio sp.]|jgi:peptide/nickel transport system permease protein|uniref:ABC transporter permease n=1 Tax=uncultured Ferrovibrio sp. TaxID=1576913 RepID=UPI002619D775|nr:ABC transporter permease [uncultured Ferrovibrio sp.]